MKLTASIFLAAMNRIKNTKLANTEVMFSCCENDVLDYEYRICTTCKKTLESRIETFVNEVNTTLADWEEIEFNEKCV